jgi:zinc protease
MSKNPKKKLKNSSVSGYDFIQKVGDIYEFRLKSNGLVVLYKSIKGTGVVTTNITYKVGARDERNGETGVAHMLEHMLFKPTKQDLKKKIDSGAMQFERETGCHLNANTWKDRTTYFFSYPVEHFKRAVRIEAERMTDVVLTNKEFLPERNNVLSEFDMYNGDPHFALAVQMVCAAYQSHPYGHETIGFREDIEQYTPERLDAFYKNYYRPDNATLTIVGDIQQDEALVYVKSKFSKLLNPKTPIPRHTTVEPKQEGVRRTSIVRESGTNLLSFGVKHAGFATQEWFETSTLFTLLTDGTDSVLYKKLVDTGLATSVSGGIEPTSEENLGLLTVTLSSKQNHAEIEKIVLDTIHNLQKKDIDKLLKKIIQKTITEELFSRGSSLGVAMELTEYIAADSLQTFNQTEKILSSITSQKILNQASKLFNTQKLTVGYFIGKK